MNTLKGAVAIQGRLAVSAALLFATCWASAPAGEPVTGATGQRGKEVGWPCWRGPLGGGVVPDPGRKLVRDLSQAKLVWTSEDQLPFPYENNLGKHQGWFGGFGSPVVEDGRIYVGYVRPYGRDRFEWATNDVKRLHMPKPGEGLVRGENVIHCFDARTGKAVTDMDMGRVLNLGSSSIAGKYLLTSSPTNPHNKTKDNRWTPAGSPAVAQRTTSIYDVSDPAAPKKVGENVLTIPGFTPDISAKHFPKAAELYPTADMIVGHVNYQGIGFNFSTDTSGLTAIGNRINLHSPGMLICIGEK